jgi:hypothetical protein
VSHLDECLHAAAAGLHLGLSALGHLDTKPQQHKQQQSETRDWGRQTVNQSKTSAALRGSQPPDHAVPASCALPATSRAVPVTSVCAAAAAACARLVYGARLQRSVHGGRLNTPTLPAICALLSPQAAACAGVSSAKASLSSLSTCPG